MSQLNVDSIKDRTGADQPDIVGVAKAFVNFNGEGTVAIRSGFNVSSITDNGVGNYTVNFTNNMPTTNYTTVTSGNDSPPAYNVHTTYGSSSISGVTIIGASVTATANNVTDPATVNVAVFSN